MERYIGDEELELVRQAIESQRLVRSGWRGTPGRFVAQLEAEFAGFLGRRYALAVNSGTSALQAALAGAGIGPGDEVIVTSASFIASSMCVPALNAIPVFADVDPATLNLDPEDVARKITPRTRAIVAVHLFGQLCEMDAIMRLAAAHDLTVIEDCAQAYGSRYKGRVAGSIGHIGAFSLQQSKHVTTGEGGLLVTDDRAVYERASLYSNIGFAWIHEGPGRGSGAPYSHFAVGQNLRLGELQAAVGVAQLRKLERFNALRQRIVATIEEELRGAPGLSPAHRPAGAEPCYFFYPIRYDPAIGGVPKTELLGRVKAALDPALARLVGQYPPVANHLEPVYTTGLYKRGYPPGVRWHPEQPPIGPGLLPVLERVLPETLITIQLHHGDDPQMHRTIARALRVAAQSLAAVTA